jgi:hypothetical protein
MKILSIGRNYLIAFIPLPAKQIYFLQNVQFTPSNLIKWRYRQNF